MEPIDLSPLEAGANRFAYPLSKLQLEQFRQYAALLLAWNEKVNLTAIRSPEGIVERHFLDSISCVIATGDLNNKSVIDVGTGAGLPGLPLKILFPEMRLTLVESLTKKARFLEAVVAELRLEGVTVLAERAEAVGHLSNHREQYDWAVARAVAELRSLVEYLLPLCRLEGRVLAMKGAAAEAELAAADQAIAELGGGRAAMHAVDLPGALVLVVIEKAAATPARYPRKPGRPTKKPL